MNDDIPDGKERISERTYTSTSEKEREKETVESVVWKETVIGLVGVLIIIAAVIILCTFVGSKIII